MKNALLLGLLFAASACGARSYLVPKSSYENAINSATAQSRAPMPAFAEPDQHPVWVAPAKLKLARAEFVPDDTRLRVHPRRPTGLLAAGGVVFGIGTAITAAGLGEMYCPPNAFCEQGLAVGVLLGTGVPHMLIGGILLIAGGARYSPEVSAPAP